MHRNHFLAVALAAALVAVAASSARAPAAPAAAYFFRDGDRVLMIGDSITEQHLHSNYVEIYTVSRFPAARFTFRNVGIGGDSSAGGNKRAARDVLSFKPTAVTVTFGMNDAGYRAFDQGRFDAYVAGLQGMIDQIKPTGARIALFSSSPVEKKEDGPALEGYNQTLEQFAAGVKELATKNAVLFVDQFHPHLAVLQKARDASPANRINGGDAVHPGPPGQLLMAWAILKGLNAPALVTALEINAVAGSWERQERCKGSHFQRLANGGAAFDRLDQALPFPIQPEATPILKWAPIVEDLDQYLLKVTHLPGPTYDLSIDGEKCGTYSAAELAKGVNLALLTSGPIAKQAKAVHDAVFAKNRYYHDQIFRGVVLNASIPDDQKPAIIEERMKGMAPLEQAIRDALVLKPHRFELRNTATGTRAAACPTARPRSFVLRQQT